MNNALVHTSIVCVLFIFAQAFIVVRTLVFTAFALWIPAFTNTSDYCRPYICSQYICFHGNLFFGYKCVRSSIHMLHMLHMLYGHLQVLMIVHTHAFSTRALWTLASWYRCLRSSIHMLLVHMLYGHLLFGTSAYCRPYTCFLVQVLKDVHTHAF